MCGFARWKRMVLIGDACCGVMPRAAEVESATDSASEANGLACCAICDAVAVCGSDVCLLL